MKIFYSLHYIWLFISREMALVRVFTIHKFEGLDDEEFIDNIIKWRKEIPIKMACVQIKVENWFRDEID